MRKTEVPMSFDPVLLLPPLPKNYTLREAYVALDELYSQLPNLECKGRCFNSCTTIAASELERRRVIAAGGSIGPPMTPERYRQAKTAGSPARCPSLGPLNNCTVYAVRPFICRAFGMARDLRCEYGCVPDKILPEGEIIRIVATIEQLSRHVTGVRAWPIA